MFSSIFDLFEDILISAYCILFLFWYFLVFSEGQQLLMGQEVDFSRPPPETS